VEKKRGWGIVLAAAFVLAAQAGAQLKPEEIAKDKSWEEFLLTAKMTDVEQISGREAVTSPWKVALEKDGENRLGVWKNPEGRMSGFIEGWTWEIAAYRLDRYLGLNMVPVTVERRRNENRGSLQIWWETKMTYKTIMESKGPNKISPPAGYKGVLYNRAVYLQRAFDNLIANEDRHANNILVTDDWRLILIDHSRSFRTSPKFTESLLYNEKSKTHPGTMSGLPAAFIEKLKSLTPEVIKGIVGEYLDDKEIAAMIVRRDLILKEIDRLIAKNGKINVIY